jgi:hypothetical protein
LLSLPSDLLAFRSTLPSCCWTRPHGVTLATVWTLSKQWVWLGMRFTDSSLSFFANTEFIRLKKQTKSWYRKQWRVQLWVVTWKSCLSFLTEGPI